MKPFLELPAALKERLLKIEIMMFDVDGILTDGRLYYGPTGESIKVFNVLDGHGLKMLRAANIQTAIISGRQSQHVAQRAKELKFDYVLQGIDDKQQAFNQILKDTQKSAQSCGFMGDEWVDLPIMKRVGFAATVPNAASYVAQYAHWTSSRDGGYGAAREVCELILHAQDKLEAMFATYVND